MTAPFLPGGFRATDSNDNPLAGGYILFYEAGTTTPLAVYSEPYVDGTTPSLGTRVNINSAGVPVSGSNVPVLIYPVIGTDYKMVYYDSNDVAVPGMEFDDIPGAEAAVVASDTATPTFPVISKTSAFSVVLADRGKLFSCNPTGGSFAATLPSAVTVGDNFIVGFKHNGTAGQVSLVAISSQIIRGRKNVTSHVLASQGDIAWLLSDGSDWHVVGSEKQAPRVFTVLDSLTSPPASPTPGAMYRIDGTPTGAWSTLGFADEDLAEADGNGSWIRYTPESGWLCFDQDVEEYLKFTGGAWGSLLVAPDASTLKTMIVQDQKSSNTDGGTPTQDAWTTAVLNTSVVNTITDASLASNKITLPAGRYRVRARKVFAVTGESRIRLKKDVAGTVVGLSESVHAGNIVSTNSSNATIAITAALECEFEITESTDFILEYYVNVNQHTTATQGLGIPSNISGSVEVYATVTVEDLASQQGPAGEQGAQGEPGPVALSVGSNATIASGVIAYTGAYESVDTEASAASDDLDTITGGTTSGQLLILRTVAGARDVVIKHNTGNIRLAGGVDFTLLTVRSRIMLVYDQTATTWNELCRSDIP